jgi:tRNA A-37 threonylcarbamoyl transferase component Bud32
VSDSAIANCKLQTANCKLRGGGVCWEVQPDLHGLLLDGRALRLAEWLRDGQARIVKHGPHRTVYHVTLPDLDCHVKHYRLHDTRTWLRELVRPSKARLEYDRALAVAARGIPTITPLATGESRRGAPPGDSFLVVRTLADTVPLNVFLERTLADLPPSRQTRIRRRLAVVLGEFIARLHAAGVLHLDLHAGNLLLRLTDEDEPRLYLIDLHAVQLRRPLDWEVSRANLVIFNRWFILRASRSDRLRFWKAYQQARAAAGWPGDAPRLLEQDTWASNLRFWHSHDRRPTGSNRYFQRLHAGPVRGHAVRDLDAGLLAGLLADPDEPFRRPGAVLLKDSRSSTVAELDLSVNGVVRRVIYKRFRVTSWRDPWVALLRPSPALRSWVWGHGLLFRCLPTPRPLAVLHRFRHGCPAEGYLLVEKVPAAIELQRFVARLAELPAAQHRATLRPGIDKLAALVRELHRRRLSHRDLKAPNILVTQEGGPGTPFSFVLIDLVGLRSPRRLSWRRRVRDLARLHASFYRHPALTRTDKLRFLRVYLQWGLFGRDRWKRWWRAIDQATQDKAAANARRGRPLA